MGHLAVLGNVILLYVDGVQVALPCSVVYAHIARVANSSSIFFAYGPPRPNFPTEDKSHNLRANIVDPASTTVI